MVFVYLLIALISLTALAIIITNEHKDSKIKEYPGTVIISLKENLRNDLYESIYDFSLYDKHKIIFVFIGSNAPLNGKIPPYFIYENVAIYEQEGLYYWI